MKFQGDHEPPAADLADLRIFQAEPGQAFPQENGDLVATLDQPFGEGHPDDLESNRGTERSF